MIRNEPWEPATTLHDLQQQVKTLHDENKQQWYDRPQQNAGVPPLWLGFYDPTTPPDVDEPCCPAPACVDVVIPDVLGQDGVGTLHGGSHRVPIHTELGCAWGDTLELEGDEGEIARITINQTRTAHTQPNVYVLGVYYHGANGGTGGCFWTFTEPDMGCSTTLSKDGGKLYNSNDPEYARAGTASITWGEDCGDPTGTDTGTSSGTGSGTSPGDECGDEAPMYVWGTYAPGLAAWFPLTYPCTGGCYGLIPQRDGDYEGEIAAGTCVSP